MLEELNAGLLELKLNNLKDRNMGEIFQNFSLSLADKFNFLIKLSLSNIDISNTETVTNIAHIVSNKSYLQRLELSWCNLQPKHLCAIVEEMKQRSQQIREIDFSYNKLFF